MKRLYLLLFTLVTCLSTNAQNEPVIRLTLHTTKDTVYRVLDSTWLRRHYKTDDSMVFIVIKNISSDNAMVSNDFYVAYEGDPANLFFRTWYAENDSFKTFNYHNWDIDFMPTFEPDTGKTLMPGEEVVIYRPVFQMHGNVGNRINRAQVVYNTVVNDTAKKFESNYIDLYFSGVDDTLDKVPTDLLIEKAEAAEERGDYYTAIDAYRELSIRRPSNNGDNILGRQPVYPLWYDWQYRIGINALKLKRYEAAYMALMPVAESDTSNTTYQTKLAEAYYGAGFYKNATECYERAARISARTGILNGTLITMANKSRQKEEDAIMNDQSRLVRLARDYENVYDYYNAIELYNKAEQLAPEQFSSYSLANRARCLLKIGHPDDALTDVTRAIARSPNWGKSFSYILRAEIYVAKKKFSNACDDLERAARTTDDEYTIVKINRLKQKWCNN